MSEGFDDIADELYRLRPGEFVAERDRRAKAARDAGERELANAVKSLHRPTVGAWLVNLLAQSEPQPIEDLLALGEQLREAQATLSGSALRQLSSQRHQVVSALVQQARRLAYDAGQPVGDDAAREAEATLGAALSDPQVAQAVRQGRLTKAVDYAGLGLGLADASAPSALPASKAQSTKKQKRDASTQQQEQDEQREREVQEARRRADKARAAAEQADAELARRESQLADARASREQAASAVADLERQLSGARQRLDKATTETESASRRRDDAARAAATAQAKASEEMDRLAALG
jgi:hypothetical protein